MAYLGGLIMEPEGLLGGGPPAPRRTFFWGEGLPTYPPSRKISVWGGYLPPLQHNILILGWGGVPLGGRSPQILNSPHEALKGLVQGPIRPALECLPYKALKGFIRFLKAL